MEFKIGDTVTLDRYNHIDDVQKVQITGYGEMPFSGQITYIMDVNGVQIQSTGVSIMESKFYQPVDDIDRHYRRKASMKEIEDYWDLRRK
jgi:hypothetical protein